MANLPGHWARLPHLGEQGCHLVTAQEASSAAPQLMQEANLHRTWATEGTATEPRQDGVRENTPSLIPVGSTEVRTGGCGSSLGGPQRYTPTSFQSAPAHASALARPEWTLGGFEMPLHPCPLLPPGLLCHASCMWHRPEALRTKLPGWVGMGDSTPAHEGKRRQHPQDRGRGEHTAWQPSWRAPVMRLLRNEALEKELKY